MQKSARRKIQRSVIALIIISTLLMTVACDDYRRIAKASNDLAHLTDDVIKVVKELHDAHKISDETKNKLADALILIAKEGKAFNDALIASKSLLVNGKLPPDVFTRLSTQFDQLVQPFLDLVTQLHVLGPNGDANLAKAVAALRAAIVIISAFR